MPDQRTACLWHRCNIKQYTPLCRISLLPIYGTDDNKANTSEETPLFCAITYDHHEAVQILCRLGTSGWCEPKG